MLSRHPLPQQIVAGPQVIVCRAKTSVRLWSPIRKSQLWLIIEEE